MAEGVTEGAGVQDAVDGSAPPVPAPRPDPDPAPARLRPRTAYRQANGLTPEQAAATLALLLPDTESVPMTGDLLRQYEDWPDGGVQPSVRTLAYLAQIYRTDPPDLLDQRDRQALPAADLLVLTHEQRQDAGAGTSLASSLVGQATATLAFALAVVYAAGGLSLGLKLWFMKVPWTPVLGQIPRDLLIATAVGQVVLPCLIGGATMGILIDWLSPAAAVKPGAEQGKLDKMRAWLRDKYWHEGPAAFIPRTAGAAIVAAAVLGGVPLLILLITRNAFVPGLLQPKVEIWGACAVFSAVAISAALSAMRNLYGPNARSGRPMNVNWRRAAASGLAAFALVPLFSSVSGAFLLPPVYLCGANYLHPVTTKAGVATRKPGYMDGNLIGTNSQWVYIAQFQVKKGTTTIVGATITAVPESKVDLQSVGRSGGCGDLVRK